MKTNADIIHTKRLTGDQFDATKGSDIHSRMVMNRVIVKLAQKWPFDLPSLTYNFEQVENYLLCACKSYYFISDKNSSANERRYYFLSMKDMEEFIIWSKCALPLSDPDAG